MIDVNKFYRIAARYVGELNRDLVHHTYAEVAHKLPADNPEAFFHGAMKMEAKGNSKFRKQYREESQLSTDVMDEPEFDRLNPERVQSILEDLMHEGYRLEVKAFIELATGKSMVEFNRITGVRRDNLIKIRNFVKTEVIKRYGNTD